MIDLTKLFYAMSQLHSFRWARLVRANNLGSYHFLPCRRSGQLPLRESEFALSLSTAWALKAYSSLCVLLRAGAKIGKEGEAALVVEMGDLRFIAETPQDLHVMDEVLVRGCYNFSEDAPCVVLDIGMNVGIASLFFASKSEVRMVIGYELFEPTFKQALRNIAMNQGIGEKISPVNRGVGYPARKIELPYSYELKGSVGIQGIEPEALQFLGAKDSKPEVHGVELVDCAEVISSVKQKLQEQRLIIKLDCEGSEYEIMERLEEQGLVGAASLYLIEWHKRGPAPLVEILTRHGFASISLNPMNTYVGMIYASKQP